METKTIIGWAGIVVGTAAIAVGAYGIYKVAKRLKEEEKYADHLKWKGCTIDTLRSVDEDMGNIVEEIRQENEAEDDGSLDALLDNHSNEELNTKPFAPYVDEVNIINIDGIDYDIRQDGDAIPISEKKESEVDKTLRYEPDSPEAWAQYKTMLLAGMRQDTEEYEIINALFENCTYYPQSGDEILESNLLDMRIDFFGDKAKRINAPLTVAEVIIFFANKTAYDEGSSSAMWISTFVANLNISYEMLDDLEAMERLGIDISDRCFTVEKSGTVLYGIFGLKEQEMYSVNENFMRQYWDFLK